MKIISKGYDLKFIQKEGVGKTDSTSHFVTYIFKFFSPDTRLNYVVRVEGHCNEFFAVKFYAKKDKRSDRKYSNIINKGFVIPILITATKSIKVVLTMHPNASFGFIASRSIDINSEKVESVANNQRFNLYSSHISQLIGEQTFKHVKYTKASAYALINRSHQNLEEYEEQTKATLINDYPDLVNVS